MRKTNELRRSSTCDRRNVYRFAEFVGASRAAPDRRKALIPALLSRQEAKQAFAKAIVEVAEI